jgi:hypothetical protein
MGSVPCDCDVLVLIHTQGALDKSVGATHLHVLLGGFLPFLCHGTGSDGAGEHARESEDGKGTSDDGRGEEEDVAALIRRRGSARTVGAKGDEIGCMQSMLSVQCSYR